MGQKVINHSCGTITDLNINILNQLINDSRQSARVIARTLKISTATVVAHMKQMENAGIIQKYTTRVNFEKMGYEFEIMIDIQVEKGKLLEVEKKIAKHPNVLAVYDVTGNFDAVVLARFKTRRKMDDFLKIVQTYDFIHRTNTKIILNTIKNDTIRVS